MISDDFGCELQDRTIRGFVNKEYSIKIVLNWNIIDI